jgi:hypothetical protein
VFEDGAGDNPSVDGAGDNPSVDDADDSPVFDSDSADDDIPSMVVF